MSDFICNKIQKEGDLYTLFTENEEKEKRVFVFNTQKTINPKEIKLSFFHVIPKQIELSCLLTVVEKELQLVVKYKDNNLPQIIIDLDLDNFSDYIEVLQNLQNVTGFSYLQGKIAIPSNKFQGTYHLFINFNNEEKDTLCQLIDAINTSILTSDHIKNELMNIQTQFDEYKYGLKLVSLETFTFLKKYLLKTQIFKKIITNHYNTRHLIIEYLIEFFSKGLHWVIIDAHQQYKFTYRYHNCKPLIEDVLSYEVYGNIGDYNNELFSYSIINSSQFAYLNLDAHDKPKNEMIHRVEEKLTVHINNATNLTKFKLT